MSKVAKMACLLLIALASFAGSKTVVMGGKRPQKMYGKTIT